jgi:hypothetical protein
MEPRSIARRSTGVLQNALWTAADAIIDRVSTLSAVNGLPLALPRSRPYFVNFSGAKLTHADTCRIDIEPNTHI